MGVGGGGGEFQLAYCFDTLLVHNPICRCITFSLLSDARMFFVVVFPCLIFFFPDTHHVLKVRPFKTREEWAEKLAAGNQDD